MVGAGCFQIAAVPPFSAPLDLGTPRCPLSTTNVGRGSKGLPVNLAKQLDTQPHSPEILYVSDRLDDPDC